MAAPMAKKESVLPVSEPEAGWPQLKRVLGRRDLVLLFVVAVFSLNVVGLGVGKWLNDVGGIGTRIAAAVQNAVCFTGGGKRRRLWA
jgi:hypothetical protein